MFNLRLCNAAIIRYSQLKFGHMHLCGMDYKYFIPHCCKCNSFGCTAAIRCDNACHGPHSDSLYSGSEHCQFNSPRLVKREAGFPNPRRALIGSNQLWRVNDSAYYREYFISFAHYIRHQRGILWKLCTGNCHKNVEFFEKKSKNGTIRTHWKYINADYIFLNMLMLKVPSGAVTTRFNIKSYCTHHGSDLDRI